MVSGPVIPENVLKRRKQLEQIQAERQERLAEQRAKKKPKAGNLFKKASEFIAQYRAVDTNVRRMRREMKKPVPLPDPDSRLLLAVRVRGMDGLDQKTRKFLKVLRLTQVCPIMVSILFILQFVSGRSDFEPISFDFGSTVAPSGVCRSYTSLTADASTRFPICRPWRANPQGKAPHSFFPVLMECYKSPCEVEFKSRNSVPSTLRSNRSCGSCREYTPATTVDEAKHTVHLSLRPPTKTCRLIHTPVGWFSDIPL